jgi:SRSO17 transposase
MLPECRTNGEGFPIPKFSIENRDVQEFMEELRGFHEEFRDCFVRSEPRENFFRYMVGQLSELERKSIEPIALQVEGGNVRSLQKFVTDAVWDGPKMLEKYHTLVKEDLGDGNGVLIFDETGFPKKGEDSAGVARQYCGTLGKVDNCQVGVFAAYASKYGYSLVDKRLFIPEKWFSEAYAGKRSKCDLPENLEFKTKPQLAANMLLGIAQADLLPFKYVTADTIYGNSDDFLHAVEQLPGIVYFVAISAGALCWLQPPRTVTKKYRYKNEVRHKKLVPKSDNKPITVEELAKSTNKFFWYRRKVSEGTKGPIEYEFTKKPVILSKNGLPGRRVTLIIKRTMSENPTYSYHISNAPFSTRLSTFVWLSGMRWPIEQCFEETKTELGMDHYEVRKYPSWHHHILTCMLAHFFLWHLKIKLGGKSSTYYSVAA